MPIPTQPDWPRAAPAPGVRTFALLGGLEAGVRAILTSVLPLEMYAVFQNADQVSIIYLGVGLLSMIFGLMVPRLTTILPRRWTYSLGVGIYLVGHIAGMIGGAWMPLAVIGNMVGTVTCFICLNAYILDYIARSDMSRNETMRMVFSGAAWVIGPISGVTLYQLWRPLPFMVAFGLALVMLATFWVLRLGNGKVITKARGPAPNPLAFIGRFLEQPRLIAGWTFAVLRSAAWLVFTIYLPIYAVSEGLDPRIGGAALSVSCLMMFTTPLMLKWMQRTSLRHAIRTGFVGAAVFLFLSALFALLHMPWTVVVLMTLATCFLVLLDVSAGLPFLLAVKPSERTEMAAIYSSFRDVSGIVTPGLASIVLLVAPLPWLFAAMGGIMVGCWGLAGKLHPRLGASRK